MSRPKLAPGKGKTSLIFARVTDAEKKTVEAKSKKEGFKKPSQYVRFKVLS